MNKKFSFLVLILLGIAGVSFANKPDMSNATYLFNRGEFTGLRALSDSLKNSHSPNSTYARQVDSLCDIASRIQWDFGLSEPKAEAQIRADMGSFTLENKKRWEQNGWLEYTVIDGQKRYFNKAVDNLKRKIRQYEDSITHQTPATDSLALFRLNHSEQVVAAALHAGAKMPQPHFSLLYTLSVKPDAVPDGQTVNAWLPYPKDDEKHQRNIHPDGASPASYTLADDWVGCRSVFMEKKAAAGKFTDFTIRLSCNGVAQYVNLEKASIRTYVKRSDMYQKYTAQDTFVVFSERVKSLANIVAGKEKRPEKIVRKLFEWISTHILVAAAPEYIPDNHIADYVLQRRQGDSNLMTILFMSMARYKGIPVKWQSGWVLFPNDIKPHAWCEVYYEGVGWVPLDVAFGLQNSPNPDVRYFYMSGMDAYHLPVSDEAGGVLTPLKKYRRSDPIGFERGEAEWSGGNLYFDKWEGRLNVDVQ